MRYQLIAFAFIASSICAHAQTIVKDTVHKEHQLQPVEVRALRAGSDAPFAKTDVTKKDIEKQNLGQDLPILLQYTPSAVTTSDAGGGVGYTGLRIRGTDATRINVTMNGIPVNDPEEQGTYFVDFPDIASSTSSIQIQRGVGTSTNGAGAFGATISLNNLQQFDSAGVILNSSAGSFNTLKNTLLAGTGMLKGGWQFDVRLSKLNSDGYIQRGSSDLKSMQFTAGWKANENTWLHFMVMTGIEKTGQAWDGVLQDSLKTNRTYNDLGLKPDSTYYKNQTDNYQQDYYQLFGDHKFSPYLTAHVGLFMTRGKGYYEEYKQGELLSNYGLAAQPEKDTNATGLIRQLWLDNYYYGYVFSLLYERNKTQFVFGGGWTQFDNQHYGIVKWTANGGSPDDYKWYNHDAQKNDFNVYMKLQQKVGDKLILFGDAQVRSVSFFINGFQDHPDLKPSATYFFFNPKAGLTYLMRNTASEKQKLYASVAVANREPNSADFEVDVQHQPKAEKLYDIEAGYEINKRKWSANANLYYMRYNNQLVLTGQINDVGAYTQTNVSKSYRAGIELIGAVKPTDWVNISANATFSQNKIGSFIEYLDNWDNGGQNTVNHSNTDIAFAPNVVATGTVTFAPFYNYPKGKTFEIGISEKYVGKQYLDNTSNNARAIDAYNYCNLLLRYSIKTKPFKELGFSLMMNNILNAKYNTNGWTYAYLSNQSLVTQNHYFPQAGFHFFGGITVKF